MQYLERTNLIKGGTCRKARRAAKRRCSFMWIRKVVSAFLNLTLKTAKVSPIPPNSNALETSPPQNNDSLPLDPKGATGSVNPLPLAATLACLYTCQSSRVLKNSLGVLRQAQDMLVEAFFAFLSTLRVRQSKNRRIWHPRLTAITSNM